MAQAAPVPSSHVTLPLARNGQQGKPIEGPAGSPGMHEVCFSCPLCSRMFVRDRPPDAVVPRHLDALLGLPCEGTGLPVTCYLDLPNPPQG